LHELDRFVRHQLKPLAYVRYGDDFVLFARSQNEALYFQRIAGEWLAKELHLTLHPKNNIVIQVKQGLHILGHWIYPKHQIIIDGAMSSKVYRNLNIVNAATYKSLHQPKRRRKIMSHLLTQSLSQNISSKQRTKR
jgi:hypothetical protein